MNGTEETGPDGDGVNMHADQIAISEHVVRALVAEQFPRWRELGIRRVAGSGTVNAIFRVGQDLAARFPLQGSDPGTVWSLLEDERDAITEFVDQCPFPTPQVVTLGRPGQGFPLPWSVQSWLPGTPASEVDPGASSEFAEDLACLIERLRAADPRGRRFSGTNRGGDLRRHDAWMATCLERSEELLDVAVLGPLWSRLRDLPRRNPDRMCHGDLIPGNVLVADGRLAGVLDAGGYGPADPALDLVAAWHLLDDGPRETLRQLLDVDDLEWRRGLAWAFEQAMGVVWYYRQTNEAMSRMGRLTLQRICANSALLD